MQIKKFLAIIILFLSHYTYSQSLTNVKFPLLLKKVELDTTKLFDEYYVDSVLINHNDTVTYFRFLTLKNYKHSNTYKYDDSSIIISLSFEFFDTISINGELYLAFNPYSRVMFESSEYDKESGITDGIIVREPTFIISRGQVKYAPFELTDDNIHDFFFSNKIINYIKVLGNDIPSMH